MNSFPPLTDEEVQALQCYAAKHGRYWKTVLNGAWMGEAPYDDGGTLVPGANPVAGGIPVFCKS